MEEVWLNYFLIVLAAVAAFIYRATKKQSIRTCFGAAIIWGVGIYVMLQGIAWNLGGIFSDE